MTYHIKYLVSVICLILVTGHSVYSTESIPQEFIGVGITEKIKATLPSGLTFMNSAGDSIRSSDLFHSKRTKPVILSLVYFDCPMLCNLVLSGLLNAINGMDMPLGDRFDVVTISFDPKDTPTNASDFRQSYIKQLHQKHNPQSWNFLVANDQPTIDTITQSVGFNYKRINETKDFSHTAALVVLTPQGEISRYLYGINFDPFDLKMSLLEASDRKFISTLEQGLLFCYNYDPDSRGYSIQAFKFMQIGCIIAIIIISFIVFRAIRKDKYGRKEL